MTKLALDSLHQQLCSFPTLTRRKEGKKCCVVGGNLNIGSRWEKLFHFGPLQTLTLLILLSPGFCCQGGPAVRSLLFHSGPTKVMGDACGSRRPQTVVVTTKHGKRQNRAQNRRSGQHSGVCLPEGSAGLARVAGVLLSHLSIAPLAPVCTQPRVCTVGVFFKRCVRAV